MQAAMNYVLLPIPAELLEEANLSGGDVVQFTAEDGKLVLSRAELADYVCDGDCKNCPLEPADCDEDCTGCPCQNYCEECEV